MKGGLTPVVSARDAAVAGAASAGAAAVTMSADPTASVAGQDGFCATLRGAAPHLLLCPSVVGAAKYVAPSAGVVEVAAPSVSAAVVTDPAPKTDVVGEPVVEVAIVLAAAVAVPVVVALQLVEDFAAAGAPH